MWAAARSTRRRRSLAVKLVGLWLLAWIAVPGLHLIGHHDDHAHVHGAIVHLERAAHDHDHADAAGGHHHHAAPPRHVVGPGGDHHVIIDLDPRPPAPRAPRHTSLGPLRLAHVTGGLAHLSVVVSDPPAPQLPVAPQAASPCESPPSPVCAPRRPLLVLRARAPPLA